MDAALADGIDINHLHSARISDLLQSCEVINWMATIPALVGFAQTAIFSALRVCAIWDRNYVLFIIVLVLGLPPVVTTAPEAPSNIFLHQLVHAWTTLSTPVIRISSQISSVTFITRVPLILADLLVLVLTWMKTYRQYKEARSLNIKSSLITCLIHDSTVYFFILLALNASQVLFFCFSSTTIIFVFTTTLPQILICRFMMNLRLLNLDRSTTSDIGTFQLLASLRVLTVNNDATPSSMGNVSESLGYDQDDGENDNAHISGEQSTSHSGEEPDV
ncbi:uncharacterized protein PHACADRAFT_206472 [Phanerochaete carnosa HHB-10118-sp]|uniref:Uncharacterized protein n=1 Tax=Phanerochaete carnosa (strain HHB-10118-sp) TaxID=650164 RepID=K5X419_PHACS|nr:uncharacterized protein PHACADRAFT_206472 [Phanerochaete carnosa HHB-10118-sp]EKM57577.1 hypothetical protein PHACADRAFT_206472 [Phanerochaete carnosa HHB-10118-sp]